MTKFLVVTSEMLIIGFTLTPEWNTSASILIAALFVGLVSLYNAKTQRMVAMKEVAKAVAPLVAKIDEIAPVVDRINVHVNSEKDRAIAELKERDLQIRLQRELIEEMKTATALLAQAKAGTDMAQIVASAAVAGATTPPALSGAPAEQSLKQIDDNTAAIQQNTARTDATVQDLKKE